MNNLERFTSPASGANIKKLLKELNDKGAQLRSVLWLETQTTSTPVEGVCDCGPDDDEDSCDYCLLMESGEDPEQFSPCQLELSVGNNVVLTEIFTEQINQVLPLIKEWVIRDLEIIEHKLNDQGVYLEGPGANQAEIGGLLPSKPFKPVNIQFLSKNPEKGDLVVTLVEVVVSLPIHPNDEPLILKKGTRCRVMDMESKLCDHTSYAHVQPENEDLIYIVLANQVQPIQE